MKIAAATEKTPIAVSPRTPPPQSFATATDVYGVFLSAASNASSPLEKHTSLHESGSRSALATRRDGMSSSDDDAREDDGPLGASREPSSVTSCSSRADARSSARILKTARVRAKETARRSDGMANAIATPIKPVHLVGGGGRSGGGGERAMKPATRERNGLAPENSVQVDTR